MSAVVLTLGGDDIVEVGVPDREQVEDSEREKKVEVRDKQEKDKHEETTNAQTHYIMDDMWIE